MFYTSNIGSNVGKSVVFSRSLPFYVVNLKVLNNPDWILVVECMLRGV
jgi:hypothetical protein